MGVHGERLARELRAAVGLAERFRDGAGVVKELRVLGAERERFIHRGLRLARPPRAVERPRERVARVDVAPLFRLFFGQPQRLGRLAALGREKERERARVRQVPPPLDLGVRRVGPRLVARPLARLAEQPRRLDQRALRVGPREELGRPPRLAARERDAPLADQRRRVVGEERERPIEAGLGPLDVALVPEDHRRLREHPRPRFGVARVDARVDRLARRRLRPLEIAVQPAQVRGARERGQVRLQVDHVLRSLDRLGVAAQLERRVAAHPERHQIARVLVEHPRRQLVRLAELVLVQPHLRPQPERQEALRVDPERPLGARVGVRVVARVARLARLAHPSAPEQHPAVDPLGLRLHPLLVLLDEPIDRGRAARRRQRERVARGRGRPRRLDRGPGRSGRRRRPLAAGRERARGDERRRERAKAPPSRRGEGGG